MCTCTCIRQHKLFQAVSPSFSQYFCYTNALGVGRHSAPERCESVSQSCRDESEGQLKKIVSFVDDPRALACSLCSLHCGSEPCIHR